MNILRPSNAILKMINGGKKEEAAKLIFKADCAGKTFSILQISGQKGVRYSVGESDVDVLFTFGTLEKAYSMLMQRMHIRYSHSEVEQRLKNKNKEQDENV